ncbi:hypothetical protein ES702_03712 [subsurface metagenome]
MEGRYGFLLLKGEVARVEAVLTEHALGFECCAVFREDVVEDVGAVSGVVVSHCDDLDMSVVFEFKWGYTHWELIADDKDGIWFAADTDPSIVFHLLQDDFLQTPIAVYEILLAQTPE